MPKTIKQLDKNTIKMLRAEIDNALENVLDQYGLKADIGTIRFGKTDFRCKLEVALNTGTVTAPADAVADLDPAEERKFHKHAYKFGIPKDAFGKSFTVRRTVFTITEINPRAKRGGYPVIATNARGTTYKFPAEKAHEAV